MRNNQKELHSSQSTESIYSGKWVKGATCSLSNVNNVPDFDLNYIAKRKGKFCWRLPSVMCHFPGSKKTKCKHILFLYYSKSKIVFMVSYIAIIPNWSISLVLPKFLWEKLINVLLYGKQLYTYSGTILLVRSLVISKASLWKWQKTSSTIHLTVKQYFFQFSSPKLWK